MLGQLSILYGSFSLWGWNVVWFVALQDLTPVSHDVCCPLILFLCLFGMFAETVFFLSFSFSQALGKPKPLFGGLGFPLRFFIVAEHDDFNPYSLLLIFTKVPAPPCFFLSVGARVGVFFSGVVLLCLSVCLSVLSFCTHLTDVQCTVSG